MHAPLLVYYRCWQVSFDNDGKRRRTGLVCCRVDRHCRKSMCPASIPGRRHPIQSLVPPAPVVWVVWFWIFFKLYFNHFFLFLYNWKNIANNARMAYGCMLSFFFSCSILYGLLLIRFFFSLIWLFYVLKINCLMRRVFPPLTTLDNW